MNIEAPKEMLNIGALNEIAISIEGDAEAAPNALLDTQNRIYSEGDPKSTSNTIELEDDQPLEGYSGWMYKAASEGDWAAAETILRRDPDLFWVEKSEEIRQTALHLAVKGKHTDFIRKLTRWIGTNDVDDLCLRDGNGYTACCYAAMDGNVEHVRIMMEANPSVLDVQNSKGTTPFELLVSNRNPKTVPHFLSVTTIEDLMSEKWFRRFREVLLKKRMFDVALEFLENEKRVALLTDVGHDDRTALHILAGIDLSRGKHTIS